MGRPARTWQRPQSQPVDTLGTSCSWARLPGGVFDETNPFCGILWTQGIFELTKSYLESLLDALDDTEFGLFIFGTDDVTKIRGADMNTARDNVVFELGLFIGRLGRKHTFIMMRRGFPTFTYRAIFWELVLQRFNRRPNLSDCRPRSDQPATTFAA